MVRHRPCDTISSAIGIIINGRHIWKRFLFQCLWEIGIDLEIIVRQGDWRRFPFNDKWDGQDYHTEEADQYYGNRFFGEYLPKMYFQTSSENESIWQEQKTDEKDIKEIGISAFKIQNQEIPAAEQGYKESDKRRDDERMPFKRDRWNDKSET